MRRFNLFPDPEIYSGIIASHHPPKKHVESFAGGIFKMERDIERITAKIIEDNFHLEQSTDQDGETLKKIRGLLVQNLDFLIDHDFEKLLSILYRIDVSERKVKEALESQTEHKPSELLADFIIMRQIEKAKTRVKYGHQSDNDDDDYNY